MTENNKIIPFYDISKLNENISISPNDKVIVDITCLGSMNLLLIRWEIQYNKSFIN